MEPVDEYVKKLPFGKFWTTQSVSMVSFGLTQGRTLLRTEDRARMGRPKNEKFVLQKNK